MDSVLNPQLVVITGCMFSGKTEELIRQLKRSRIAGLGVVTFKPARDTRTGAEVKSRSGGTLDAHEVKDSAEILTIVKDVDHVVGIDEAQFFDPGLVDVVLQLIRKKKRVIVSGLDTDSFEKPFEVMAQLIALAHPVVKLTAVCMKCRVREATRSQRLNESFDRIQVGDGEYEPRCLGCYEPVIR
ncbi:thymidine kinase [Candidatus Uhrbacteria bacterium CG_4_9_14_3_um_filter_41_35]|uniref:Thymidine kinase n=1 Tax=Candidatus Uhrbacteria bacterium CG_4_9_14_3_um_filter_41_35 TaxID=1975034 RepID=A0A2M7XD44_9BACT|nr:MAG: thymidine kinase [Candidatus Uhrbacteria bacterium CG11_big_fil_rev_8_21_14_0_20_41_9]PJA45810.1 MAG: thymidine kinase [Candidatus Uhrbacteria bacterium CG_4_9_14_3_um_filter_41_35]